MRMAGPYFMWLRSGVLVQVVSASGIVFANKAVMTTFGFKFIYALTLIHTIFTLVGMQIFSLAVQTSDYYTHCCKAKLRTRLTQA